MASVRVQILNIVFPDKGFVFVETLGARKIGIEEIFHRTVTRKTGIRFLLMPGTAHPIELFENSNLIPEIEKSSRCCKSLNTCSDDHNCFHKFSWDQSVVLLGSISRSTDSFSVSKASLSRLRKRDTLMCPLTSL